MCIAQCALQVHNANHTLHATNCTLSPSHHVHCISSSACSTLSVHTALVPDCVFMVTLALLLTIARYSQKLDHRDLDQMTLGGNRML